MAHAVSSRREGDTHADADTLGLSIAGRGVAQIRSRPRAHVAAGSRPRAAPPVLLLLPAGCCCSSRRSLTGYRWSAAGRGAGPQTGRQSRVLYLSNKRKSPIIASLSSSLQLRQRRAEKKWGGDSAEAPVPISGSPICASGSTRFAVSCPDLSSVFCFLAMGTRLLKLRVSVGISVGYFGETAAGDFGYSVDAYA